jgi:hypothetical protein
VLAVADQLDEGRHSWDPGEHPRDGDGKFAPSPGGGKDSAPSAGKSKSSSGRGMPKTLATSRIQRTGGGTLTMSRHADGSRDISDGQHTATLSRVQANNLITTLELADSEGWPAGESDDVPGVGTITARGRGRYDIAFDDGGAMTVTGREASRMGAADRQLDKAHRINTAAGEIDVYADGNRKIGIRHLGDDGKPVEVLFNRASFEKISDAITSIVDDIDLAQPGDEPARTKTVSTNVGKVTVEVVGDSMKDGPGNRIVIAPADGGDWGVVIDGKSQGDWYDAASNILYEAEQPMQHALSELVSLTEAAGGTAPKGRKFRARIIAGDVQGSSGYYSAAMLKRDASVFREGLPVFLDHPGATESYDRPERSVKDLAGRLASEAVYERDGLYADVEVYPHWAPVIEAMASDIGMSIRASGTVEPSQKEGVRGPIVTSLTEASSVDFVTAAGAGGKVVALLESARAQSGDLLRKAVDTRALPKSDAEPNEEIAAATRAVVEHAQQPIVSLVEAADHQNEQAIEPAPAEAREASAPVNVPAPPANTQKEAAPMTGGTIQQGAPNGGPIELSEAELRTSLAETKQRLAEAELEIAKLGDQSRQLAEAKTKLAEAERTNLRLIANNSARDKAVETLAESTLPEVAHAKVIESVTGANVPLNEDGALDEAALVKTIKAAIERERDYLSKFAEAAGIGQVRGLGGGSEPHVNLESELGDVFKSLGMNESAASVAAKGRS